MGQHDPLIKEALITIIERDFIKCLPNDKKEQSLSKNNKGMSLERKTNGTYPRDSK